mgnify:CR=1 FL=1
MAKLRLAVGSERSKVSQALHVYARARPALPLLKLSLLSVDLIDTNALAPLDCSMWGWCSTLNRGCGEGSSGGCGAAMELHGSDGGGGGFVEMEWWRECGQYWRLHGGEFMGLRSSVGHLHALQRSWSLASPCTPCIPCLHNQFELVLLSLLSLCFYATGWF